ncbi:MAG TPA: sulfur carrier protein ThiS [Candidatus Fimimorpha faecalis]|uniref:Sulfur carrier protein ThiS n=1 Tax=Candidatus Fimimorpha faecalis TaxID=2840824 RepID=A0A9D1EE19_9FIRM|nr:sulfur carrier protein ThiS [Candidatus Fimimorpha faecalis]
MARINGIEEATDGMTLSELLEKKGYSKRFIAVECNGQIVPKTLYDSYEIQREDQIEIVQFVGGG